MRQERRPRRLRRFLYLRSFVYRLALACLSEALLQRVLHVICVIGFDVVLVRCSRMSSAEATLANARNIGWRRNLEKVDCRRPAGEAPPLTLEGDREQADSGVVLFRGFGGSKPKRTNLSVSWAHNYIESPITSALHVAYTIHTYIIYITYYTIYIYYR